MTGELILIVEDNDKNLKLARDVLQYRGFRTLEAMTAAEGIKLALEHRPDLVLMDIQLPDADGVSALQQLRAEPTTRAIPVVAFTASVMERVGAWGHPQAPPVRTGRAGLPHPAHPRGSPKRARGRPGGGRRG